LASSRKLTRRKLSGSSIEEERMTVIGEAVKIEGVGLKEE